MRVALLNKKAGLERHPFSPTDLYNLVEAIQNPLAIFEYSKPNMRNLIVDLTRGGKHFLVGVTMGYQVGDESINSVSGLFPKENHEWIKWIQDGKAIRIDQKEKVLSLINSLRTNPEEANRIGLNLDDATKVVETFQSPPIPNEESSTRHSLRQHNRQPGQMDTRAADLYEEMLSGRWSQIDEAWHDDLVSVRRLQEALEQATGRRVRDYENVYLNAVHNSSKNKVMMDRLVSPQIRARIHQSLCNLPSPVTFAGGFAYIVLTEAFACCGLMNAFACCALKRRVERHVGYVTPMRFLNSSAIFASISAASSGFLLSSFLTS